MTAHDYRSFGAPVAGGKLTVGIWDPTSHRTDDVLLVHGITSSHLAWPFVVDRLPGVRAIAPDLRGRGRSNHVEGAAGMRAHADDLARTLDALGIARILVAGHSMGAFVSVVFAHLHPDRVAGLVLIDGGLPLDVPSGLDADTLVTTILGPTAARLSMRFPDVHAYLDFWRQHPAFRDEWSSELEHYLAYDLVPDGAGGLRPATSYRTTVEDTIDMNAGTALTDALEHLAHPARLVTVPFGLQNESPGLYAPEHLASVLAAAPGIRHDRLTAFNHYTIVLAGSGADAVARIIREELDASADG